MISKHLERKESEKNTFCLKWDSNPHSKSCNTSFERSDLHYLVPQAQGSGSSLILYHALMKIGILYEKLA